MLSPALGAAEVPGRVPARPHLADAGRADGRAPSRTSRGGRLLLNVVTGGESARAAGLRRLPRQGGPLRTLRRVPARSSARLWAGETVDFERRAPPRRGRDARRSPAPGARDLLRRLVAGRRHGRRQARRRLPHLGRAAGGRRREDRLDPRAAPRPRAAASASASGCTPSPATPSERGLGRGAPPARRDRRRDHRARSRRASRRSESEGQRRMLELQRRLAGRPRDLPRTSGPASAWSAAAPAPRWSAATRRWPTGSRSTTDLGIDEFVLSGYPHLEEAYWFGEGVLPVLGRPRALAAPGAADRTRRRSVPFASRGGLVTAPRTRRRRRQPEAGLAHPRGRGLTSPSGSPARSRTWSSTSPTVGPGLLDLGRPDGRPVWSQQVSSADLLVVAQPTYKATYTGLLKLFLDQLPGDGLRGVTAVPLMLGAGPGTRAGSRARRCARCSPSSAPPCRCVASTSLDTAYDDPAAYAAWLDAARPVLARHLDLTADLTTGATR